MQIGEYVFKHSSNTLSTNTSGPSLSISHLQNKMIGTHKALARLGRIINMKFIFHKSTDTARKSSTQRKCLSGVGEPLDNGPSNGTNVRLLSISDDRRITSSPHNNRALIRRVVPRERDPRPGVMVQARQVAGTLSFAPVQPPHSL